MATNHVLWRALCVVLAPCLWVQTGPAEAAVELGSDTILRWYEREGADGDEQTVLPAYEYLRLGYGNLDGDGLSLHLYGWGRYDFGGDYLKDEETGDRAEAELLYGFVEYRRSSYNILARLGRQHVFTGTSNESLDGVRLASDLSPYFSVDLYGGLPVSVEEEQGRDGDRLWGGRLGHTWKTLYAVGLSYKRLDNDGDRTEEVLAVDTFVNLPGPLSVSGLSARSQQEGAWQEHSYRAQAWAGSAELAVTFERIDYDAYFDLAEELKGVFGFLAESGEVVTQWGAEAAWGLTSRLSLEGRFQHFDYREADDTAQYYAGLATLRGDGRTELGVEAGRMHGDREETRYTLGRAYFYWDGEPAFLSGDVVYARYDEDILGEDTSVSGSLGTGMRFLDDALEARLSADYSVDPYFDDDLRAMLSLSYRLNP